MSLQRRNPTSNARVFFAFLPDAETRAAWQHVQAGSGWSGRPVAPRNLHLTLVFVGHVPHHRLAALVDLARTVDAPSAALKLDRTGWFRRSRVGWLGCSASPHPSWPQLVEALRTGLVDLGIVHDQRNWVPHVTLYREMRTAPPILTPDRARALMPWKPDQLCLMESTQDAQGLRYVPVT